MKRLLLDTEVLIWWDADDPRLGPRARADIQRAENLNDPFDRLILAVAQLEALTIVTSDDRIKDYGLPLIDARA